MICKKSEMPIYATRGTIDAIQRMPKFADIDPARFIPIRSDEKITIKDMQIDPMRISHDAAEPVGYRVMYGHKKACVCTDLGCYTDYTVECLKNADVVLLESNHDVNMLQVGHYPYRLKQRILGDRGHLSNVSSGRLLSRVLNDHLRAIFLGHLSKENNIPELAFETVRVEIMFSESGYRAEELPIQVAKRSEPSALVEF
jgi:phosphoribosyl 1,2-cyclic phosphodiesterase